MTVVSICNSFALEGSRTYKLPKAPLTTKRAGTRTGALERARSIIKSKWRQLGQKSAASLSGSTHAK